MNEALMVIRSWKNANFCGAEVERLVSSRQTRPVWPSKLGILDSLACVLSWLHTVLFVLLQGQLPVTCGGRRASLYHELCNVVSNLSMSCREKKKVKIVDGGSAKLLKVEPQFFLSSESNLVDQQGILLQPAPKKSF